MSRTNIATLTLAAAVAIVGGEVRLPAPAWADATAATGAPAAMMDCSKASTMMSKAMPATHGSMAMQSGSKQTLDQQYASAMMEANKTIAAMSKVEAQCGKDPKVQAMARKMLDNAQMEQPNLEELTRHSS